MVRITAYILLFLFLFSCQHGKKEKNQELNDLESIKKKGELTVLTLYSSTSYFLYRGEEMGYEYELIKQFAESEGLKINSCCGKYRKTGRNAAKGGRRYYCL